MAFYDRNGQALQIGDGVVTPTEYGSALLLGTVVLIEEPEGPGLNDAQGGVVLQTETGERCFIAGLQHNAHILLLVRSAEAVVAVTD